MACTAPVPNVPLVPDGAHGNAVHASAGPVDVATGVVHTPPLTDLVLLGPLPLELTRSYSTAARDRDCGLGFGWSHSFDWEVTTDARAVRLRAPHGSNWSRAVFTSDRAVLDDLEVVRVKDELRVRDARDQRLYWFRPETEGGGAEGCTRVRWFLARVSDVRGNEILLFHERGRLSELRDSVGRRLRVMRRSGRIRAFEVFDDQSNEWVATRRYEHDEAGDLVAALDGYGRATRFRYVDHLLVEQRMPDGFGVHYRYDETRRCIATWGAFDVGADGALDPELPRLLADGKSPARGALHHTFEFSPRFVQVTNSLGLQRLFTNHAGRITKTCHGPVVQETQFDYAGRLLGCSDGEGATTRYEYDADGLLRRSIDPLGGEQTWQYDARGYLAAHTSVSGLTTQFDRDPFGDVLHAWDDLGPIVSYDYDTRGLITQVVRPNGGSTTMTYDAAGNRIGVREPSGAERSISYTHDGRPRSVVDENGHTTHFAYGRNRELLAIVDHTGVTLRKFSYDKNARLESITLRNGTYFELAYGGFDKVVAVRRPDGSSFRFSYDREGNLVRVRRPDGAEHRIVRDTLGRIVGERTFDGRDRTYQLDKAGRILWAKTDETSCRYAHDARGRIIREEQVVAGVAHVVTTEWNGDLAVGKKLGDGFEQRIAYDVAARVESITLDRLRPMRFGRDAKKRELGRGMEVSSVDEARVALHELLGQVTALVPGVLRPQLVAVLRASGSTDEHDESRERSAERIVIDEGCFAPDGSRARDTHDAHGRRLLTERFGPDGELVGSTRYVWDGEVLLQTIRRDAGSREEEQTYVHDPSTGELLAQRTRASGASRWTFFAGAVESQPDLALGAA